MSAQPLAVIPAAGLGTRMQTVSPGLSKELLPLDGRTAIAYALRETALAQLPEAALILHPDKKDLARALQELEAAWPETGAPPLPRLHVFMQQRRLGECDAIAQARDLAAGRPLAVIYPDNVPRPPGALKRLAQTYDRRPGHITALTRVTRGNRDALTGSGRVELEPDTGDPEGLRRITAFLPKQPGPFPLRREGELRTCGMYAAGPDYFQAIDDARLRLPEGRELTDGFVRRSMLEVGTEFFGLELPGEVHDVGVPKGYARAQEMVRW
jgi:UTP--glucose-1-phosphate uridylyltransferase